MSKPDLSALLPGVSLPFRPHASGRSESAPAARPEMMTAVHTLFGRDPEKLFVESIMGGLRVMQEGQSSAVVTIPASFVPGFLESARKEIRKNPIFKPFSALLGGIEAEQRRLVGTPLPAPAPAAPAGEPA